MDESEDALVPVASYLAPAEVALDRLRLEQAGIEVVLENEHLVTVNPLLGPATGGIRLCVPSDSVEKAREILARPRGRTCPACGADDVVPLAVPRWMAILNLLLLGLPLWTFRRKWTCRACGECFQ